MDMIKNEKRRATYTVNVPIQFTFAADNDLDCEELFKVATQELFKRLENGYFDVLTEKLEVPNKITHYTREEIRARNEMYDKIFRGLVL
jgi:hypothetical protein